MEAEVAPPRKIGFRPDQPVGFLHVAEADRVTVYTTLNCYWDDMVMRASKLMGPNGKTPQLQVEIIPVIVEPGVPIKANDLRAMMELGIKGQLEALGHVFHAVERQGESRVDDQGA
jgi:hypothetical protein